MTQMEKTQLVSDEQIAQYVDEGYFVLESVIGPEDLELLRSAAQFSIDRLDAAMDDAGVDRIGINAKGKRYFSNMIYQQRPELRSFIFGPIMEQICRRVLGENAYLFWEQYVIKAGDPDTTFAWHQDSGYVHENHTPYLTCWIALDDVTEENGSVTHHGLDTCLDIGDPEPCSADPGTIWQVPLCGADRTSRSSDNSTAKCLNKPAGRRHLSGGPPQATGARYGAPHAPNRNGQASSGPGSKATDSCRRLRCHQSGDEEGDSG